MFAHIIICILCICSSLANPLPSNDSLKDQSGDAESSKSDDEVTGSNPEAEEEDQEDDEAFEAQRERLKLEMAERERKYEYM